MTIYGGFLPEIPYKEEVHENTACLPSQVVQQIAKPRQPPIPMKRLEQYQYSVSLVLDNDGRIQIRSSPDMKRYKRVIMEGAVSKFEEILTDYIRPSNIPFRQRSMQHSSVPMMPQGGQFPPNSRKSSGKRRRQEAFQEAEQQFFMPPDRKLETKQPVQAGRQLQIRVDDREAQAKWFSDAFKAVQQVGCRTIAKVWIKKIHPKKQSTHPYNGGFPRDQPADANRTRPPYWPNGVIHKEPDHIDRNARTALLVHLIMNTPQPQIKSPQDSDTVITAQDLLLALEEKRNEFKVDRWSIISEIIDARRQIEMYEGGGYDPDVVIHVPDFSECTRSAREDGEGDADDNDLSAPERLSAGPVDGDGRGEERATSSVASATPSPTHFSPGDGSQVHRDPGADGDGARLPDPGPGQQQSADTFSPSIHGFTGPPLSEQRCSGMAISGHVFKLEPKHDRVPHRLQRGRISSHDVVGFTTPNNRQQPDLLTQQWLTNESPTSYLPHGYEMSNLHNQTQMSPHDFGMGEGGLVQGDMHEMGIANGLPMMDNMPFEGYQQHSRAMPVRAMSTPHTLMLDHSVHGDHHLGVAPSPFYTG